MKKKANKFVCSIAKKLVDSECNHVSREELLSVFKNVIDKLPKKDPLKIELQANLATYMKRLNRWVVKKQELLRQMKDTPKEESSKVDSQLEFAYNLYATGGFQKAVDDLDNSKQKILLAPILLAQASGEDDGLCNRLSQMLIDNTQKSSDGAKQYLSVDALIQLFRKEMMILVGNTLLKPLLQCLGRFYTIKFRGENFFAQCLLRVTAQILNVLDEITSPPYVGVSLRYANCEMWQRESKVTYEVEDIIEKKDEERGKNLQEFFLDFLAFSRFQFGQLENAQDVCTPTYEDLMAAILALFIDLSVFLSRVQDKCPSHYGKRALSRLHLILGHAPLSMLYVILQLSEPGEQDAEFMIPIYKKLLSKPVEYTSLYYCAFVLASRRACQLLQDNYPDETSKIVQTASSLEVPKDILSWLLDVAPQVRTALPESIKRKKVNRLTTFLMKDASEDTCEQLLDAMANSEGESEEDDDSSKEEENQPLFFMDASRSNEAIISMESESDSTQALRKSIDSLILGLESDNRQDNSSDSSDDDLQDVTYLGLKKKQATKSLVEKNSSDDENQIDADASEEKEIVGHDKPEKVVSEKEENSGVEANQESEDDSASEVQDVNKAGPASAKMMSLYTGSKEKLSATTVNVQANNKTVSERISRNIRYSRKSDDLGTESVSNEDETFITCVETEEERDVFFDADESIAFRNRSPKKISPLRHSSALKNTDERSLTNAPNTALSNRKSSRLAGSKNGVNQTTLDNFFITSKCASDKNGAATSASIGLKKQAYQRTDVPNDTEVVTVISDSQESESEIMVENIHTPKRSPKTKKMSQTDSVKKINNQVTKNQKSSVKIKQMPGSTEDGNPCWSDGCDSPVIPLTSSQMSQVAPLLSDSMSESEDDNCLIVDMEKHLEDSIIQGIKDIRKSTSPSLSPSKYFASQDKSLVDVKQKMNQKSSPSSRMSGLAAKIDVMVMHPAHNEDKESQPTKLCSKNSPKAGSTQIQTRQRRSQLSLKKGKPKMQDAATGPPSATKAAADFGNAYRMIAGIGLSTDSEVDRVSSLEDFRISPKKSQLQPRMLANEFSSQKSKSLKSANKPSHTKSPVKILQSLSGNKTSQVAKDEHSTISAKSSQSKKPTSYEVKGKPPIPSSSKKPKTRKAADQERPPGSPARSLRSRDGRDTELRIKDDEHSQSSSAIKSSQKSNHSSSVHSSKIRRCKRNSGSSQVSDESVGSSPRKSQRIRHAIESSQPDDKLFSSMTNIRNDGQKKMRTASQNSGMSLSASPIKNQSKRKHNVSASSTESSLLKSKDSIQDVAFSPVPLTGTGTVRTLRSRTVSEDSYQEESPGLTQVLRRDIDMRKLRSMNQSGVSDTDGEEDPMRKRMRHAGKSLEQKLAATPASSSRSNPKRKSTRKK